MTDEFDTPGGDSQQPEPRFDRYGRYLLPDPTGGKQKPWTRATTFAKTVADTFGLSRWEMRMVAAGIGMRRDLYALAASATVNDKDTLDRIAKDAKEAAAASSGANLGTALHTFTEQVDRGEPVSAPAPWDADIEAYRKAMRTAGIVAVPEWVERVVVLPDLGVAGKLDRIVRLPEGGLAIGDVKTGKDLSYSWGEIAIQLALYANAPLMWNGATGTYVPMPRLNPAMAIVMHLPAGSGTCNLYSVNIAAGWVAAHLCSEVRGWRARKDLAEVYATSPRPDRVGEANRIHGAIKAATSEPELVALYRQHQPTGAWTTAHTAAAARRKQDLYATA